MSASTAPDARMPIGSARVGALTALAVGGVLILNLGILGYAIYRAVPGGAGEVVRVVEASAPGAPGAASAPVAAEHSAQAAAVTQVSAPARPELRVVNPAMLPSREVVLGAYQRNCASCHGVSGRGDGPAARFVSPPPRNFVESPLRFARDGAPTEELEAHARRAISEGIPHSSMAGFREVLSEQEIAGLANYVAGLYADAGEPVEEPLKLGMRPPTTSGLVSRGEKLYESLGCGSCHGTTGKGDGPNIAELIDSLGKPMRPADFTSGLYKSGPYPEDLARSILLGVPGTPMIGYEAALAQENPDGSRNLSDLWAMVAYIQEFADPKKRLQGTPSGARLVTRAASDPEMLTDPAHVGWLGVRPVNVQVWPVWERTGKTGAVSIRAVHDSTRVAIAMEWEDATKDVSRDTGGFADAAAVMFSMTDELPGLPMGIPVAEHSEDTPVNMWHWQAHRQVEASAAGGVATSGEWKIYGLAGDPVAPVAVEEAPGLPSFRAAEQAGNPLSDPRLVRHSVLESNALGFGTVTLQPPGKQDVLGTALWAGGVWRVVMVRDLATGQDEDVDFARRASIPVAFAVWDGSKGDRGGTKLISGWHWLKVENLSRGAAHDTAMIPDVTSKAGNAQ